MTPGNIFARGALILSAALIVVPRPTAPHDRAFWRGIMQHEYTPPAGESAVALATELSGMLGSPDPELRDEFAYSILTAWIFQKKILDPAAIRPLMGDWLGNLKTGVGTVTGDGIFRRSFSALMLSVVVARDNAEPFLTEAEFRGVLAGALGYLGAERDLRGYDPKTGWMHATAHTADLLKFAGRSRFVTPPDQAAILDGVTARLRGAGQVFTHGEDERLARAILSIVRRTDFDRAAFERWIVNSTPANPTTATPDPAVLEGNQNLKNLFAKLAVLLGAEPAPSPDVRAATDRLRTVLQNLF